MGRPAIPISVHKARGTFRKKRHSGKLSLKGGSLGEPPAWFDSDAMREAWTRLAGLPHINDAHRAAVEHACVLYDRFVRDAKGERSMTASERQTFHSVYMQLCCTPASSAKVAAPASDKPEDPWAALG